jgi:hypothetical protein
MVFVLVHQRIGFVTAKMVYKRYKIVDDTKEREARYDPLEPKC